MSDTLIAQPPATPEVVRPARRMGATKQWPALAVLLAPTFLLLGLFLFYPVAQSFQMSTVSWDGLQPIREFVGLDNWRELFADPVFWTAVRNSFMLAIVSVIIQIPIGLGLAILLDRGSRRFRIFKIVFFLPLLMSSVAVAFLFQGVFDFNFGLLNGVLNQVGLTQLSQDWLGDPTFAIWAVLAVVSWQYIPFYMLLFLAALQGIPVELKEASMLDGASKGQYTRNIQIPMLKGAIATATLLIVIGSLKYFDLIWVMTGGGPDHATSVLATYMYEQAFKNNRVGYGATIATALFAMVFAAALIVLRFARKAQDE
jgi:raffinose/stachyose/melibiose transport system permease protein